MKEKLNANAQAVLHAVENTNTHPTAAEIYDRVRQERPGIGLASVYRILHNLVSQGCIRELHHSDDTCRYDAHIERHDHAICTACGALLDIPMDLPLAQEVLQKAALATGIELTSHEIRLYGLCPACQAQKALRDNQEQSMTLS